MTETMKAGAVGAATGQGQNLRADGSLPLPHSTTVFLRGKPVMEVVEGIAYRKAGRGERLRKPEGWSFHEEVIAQLQRAGTKVLVVEDLETEITYTVDWPTFLAKAFTLDRGAGPQRALPLAYWSVNGKPPLRREAPKRPAGPAPLVHEV